MNRLSRLATTVVVSGAVAAAGLALGPGMAAATPATGTTWCPGQALPESMIRWDMSVCHTWYFVPIGTGNVQMVGLDGSEVGSWMSADIPPPVFAPAPPPAPLPPGTPFCSPRGSLIIIPPICDEIGVDMPPGSVRR